MRPIESRSEDKRLPDISPATDLERWFGLGAERAVLAATLKKLPCANPDISICWDIQRT